MDMSNLHPRARRRQRPTPVRDVAPALTVDPLALSPAHLNALGTAVRALRLQLKANGWEKTQWAAKVQTLAADALGRLERRYGTGR